MTIAKSSSDARKPTRTKRVGFVFLTCLFAMVVAIGADAVLHHLDMGERLRGLLERARGDTPTSSMSGTGFPTSSNSVFAPLKISYYNIKEPKEDYPAGPMEILDDSTVFLIGRCGQYRIVRLREGSESTVLDSASLSGIYCGYESTGVKDVILVGDRLIFSSHVHGDSPNSVEVAIISIPIAEAMGESGQRSRQQLLWRSRERLSAPIEGTQFGGRLVESGESSVLLLVGDNGRADLASTDTSVLGKLVSLDYKNGKVSFVAKGFRSPGGFFRDEQGRLWGTDHGPKGGDEVNRIIPGNDYGWPAVTYGTIYEEERSPSYYGGKYGRHDGFAEPAWVWLPSVGPSFVSQYPTTGPVETWRGDLIVSSLRAGTLFRLRVNGDRVVYAEPLVELNMRIREFGFLSNADMLLRIETGRLARVSIGWPKL